MRKVCFMLLLAASTIITLPFNGVLFAQSMENGNYHDWNYNQSFVFGLVKLQNTTGREYYKITKTDPGTTKIQYYNSSGKLINTTVIRFVNGKINTFTRTDRWGDTYEITKFTSTAPNEFLVTRRSSGKNDMLPCKAARYIYRNNLLAEIRYVGYDNSICSNSNGVAIIRYKRYDDKNRFSLLKEVRYFDEDQMPVISKGYDCHKLVYEYNERANKISESYYGQDGEPVTDRFGCYKINYQYNDQDKITRSELLGLDDERTRNSYGVSVTQYEYDNGLLVKTTRMDDKLMITKASSAGDGVAMIHYEYDSEGNELNRYFFDEYGNRINNNYGYHKISYQYNPQHMLVEEKYYDKNLSAVNDRSGIHCYKYVKDAKGRLVQEAFFDTYGTPVKDQLDEVYMRKYKYDEYGRNTSTSFWKNEIEKMPRWDGYYEYINSFNDDGQITSMTYLDDKGNLFKSTSGYSKEVRRYDAQARISERKWFDGNNPALLTNTLASGFHGIKYYYDEKGRVASLVYYDSFGNPASAKISFDNLEVFECSKIEFYYQGNRIVEERFYKKEDTSPFKVIDCIQNNYVSVSGISKGFKNQ